MSPSREPLLFSPSQTLLFSGVERISFVGLPWGKSNNSATKGNKQARNEAAWSDESGSVCPPE